jgi:hypothetical protein
MTDIAHILIPDSLHMSPGSISKHQTFTDDTYYLQEQVLDWLVERGIRGVDWTVATGMYVDEQGFKRKSFITFVDDNVAMEFKLTWL